MLVLSRKSRESVVIGETDGLHRLCKVTVLNIRGTEVKLGFDVDPDVPVHRTEVWERIHASGPSSEVTTQRCGVAIVGKETLARPPSTGSLPLRVLMADPDESLPSVYREALAREGFQLVTAVSGLECMARLRERVPDVLVLEPHILWGGGDGVLAMLGEIPSLARLPVMVLTTCRDPDVLRDVAHFPISDYHVKPLAPELLASRLRNLLDHPGRRFTIAEQSGRRECLMAIG